MIGRSLLLQGQLNDLNAEKQKSNEEVPDWDG